MTIRLIDIEVQKRFEQERETYNLRVQDRMETPGKLDTPWPEFPKQPEPFVDSRDKGVEPHNGNSPAKMVGNSDYRGSTRDPNSFSALDFDGNSQSEVKGFETEWQCGSDGSYSNSAPFKTTK